MINREQFESAQQQAREYLSRAGIVICPMVVVNRAESPMTSTSSAAATSASGETSTPRSLTLKPAPSSIIPESGVEILPDAVQAAYRRTTYLGTPDKPGARVKLMAVWGRYCSSGAACAAM